MSPALTDQARKKIEEVVSRYPSKEAAILPILHIVQREVGFISAEEEQLVSQLLGVKPIKVKEVVTFYTMFNQKEVGKYHIQICSNLSCSLMGTGDLIDYFQEKLGIRVGETTSHERGTRG